MLRGMQKAEIGNAALVLQHALGRAPEDRKSRKPLSCCIAELSCSRGGSPRDFAGASCGPLRAGSTECSAGVRIRGRSASLTLRGPLRHHAPDQQYDNRAHDGADEARVLARLVPADRLAEVSRDERADDAEDRRKDESGRLFLPRM